MPNAIASGAYDSTELTTAFFLDAFDNGALVSTSATQLVIDRAGPTPQEARRIEIAGVGFDAPGADGTPSTGTIQSLRVRDGSGVFLFEIINLSITWPQLDTVLTSSDPVAVLALLLANDDTLTAQSGHGIGISMHGHGGADVITGGVGLDLLRGGDGADVIQGGDDVQYQNVHYGDGIDGGDGADILSGDSGNDSLIGGRGADFLFGGAGNDLLTDADAGLTDQLVMSEFPYRSAYIADRLATDNEVDALDGGDGDDSIIAGMGDLVDGGDGVDSLSANFGARGSGLNLDLSTDQAAALVAAGIGSITGVERFIVDGSAYADTMIGHSGADTLRGGDGADTIDGGAGDDVLRGASHSLAAIAAGGIGMRFDDGAVDTLRGGDGNDSILYGAGDIVDGGAGTDQLIVNLIALGSGVSLDLNANAFAAIQAAAGGSLTNLETLSQLATTDFSDTVLSSGSTTVYLQGGDDQFTGGGANQSIYGGAGADVISGMGGLDRLYGGDGADELFGGDGNDTLAGDSDLGVLGNGPIGGNDRLDGGAGNDNLSGGGGDDILLVGSGSDQGNGGAGYDILDYSTSDRAISGVSYQPPSGNAWGIFSIAQTGESNDIFGQLEELRGSAFNDVIAGTGLQAARGGDGDDQITGGGIVDGGAGDDVLRGDASANYLIGGEGADTFRYHDRASSPNLATLDAIGDFQTGIDTLDLSADSGRAFIARSGASSFVYFFHNAITGAGFEGLVQVSGLIQGSDILSGGPGVFMYGEDGLADDLRGGSGDDVLAGFSGDDLIAGGAGADALYGGDGADTFVFSQVSDSDFTDYDGIGDFTSGSDTIDLSALVAAGQTNIALARFGGSTFVYFGVGGAASFSGVVVASDSVQAADLLLGSDLALTFYGSADDDAFVGGAGSDIMLGGGGADTLQGGRGADVLTGGDGGDVFVYTATGQSTVDSYDVIRDFQVGSDLIDLSLVADSVFLTTFQGSTFLYFNSNQQGGYSDMILVQDVIVTQADIRVAGEAVPGLGVKPDALTLPPGDLDDPLILPAGLDDKSADDGVTLPPLTLPPLGDDDPLILPQGYEGKAEADWIF